MYQYQTKTTIFNILKPQINKGGTENTEKKNKENSHINKHFTKKKKKTANRHMRGYPT